MIAGSPSARPSAVEPVIGDRPVSRLVLLGRCVAMAGALLLIAAVNLALHAALGGARVPAGQAYRWEGAGPVHVTARSGPTSCLVEGRGRAAVHGYELVLGSIVGGRTVAGQPVGSGANGLVCDRSVSVTSGWVVRAYPLAGSWLRFGAYFLAILAGAAIARPTGRRPETTGPAGERQADPISADRWRQRQPPEPHWRLSGARWPHEWWANADRAGAGARPAGRPGPATNPPPQRPGWVSANVKADRIRADAGVESMRFAPMAVARRQVVMDSAGLMSFVAGLGVAPLLVVAFGHLPPGYVTYPLIVAAILGSYALVSRRLHAYILGRPRYPRPQARTGRQPDSSSNKQRPGEGGARSGP